MKERFIRRFSGEPGTRYRLVAFDRMLLDFLYYAEQHQGKP